MTGLQESLIGVKCLLQFMLLKAAIIHSVMLKGNKSVHVIRKHLLLVMNTQ